MSRNGTETYSKEKPTKDSLVEVQCTYCEAVFSPGDDRLSKHEHCGHCLALYHESDLEGREHRTGCSAYKRVAFNRLAENTRHINDFKDTPNFPHIMLGTILRTYAGTFILTRVSGDELVMEDVSGASHRFLLCELTKRPRRHKRKKKL